MPVVTGREKIAVRPHPPPAGATVKGVCRWPLGGKFRFHPHSKSALTGQGRNGSLDSESNERTRTLSSDVVLCLRYE